MVFLCVCVCERETILFPCNYPHTLVPEDVLAPTVSSVAQTVFISWSPPLTPNGVILEYRIERTLTESANFTVVGSLNGTAESLSLADTAAVPFTSYGYRVVAENSVGFAVGPATEFTTPEAGMYAHK